MKPRIFSKRFAKRSFACCFQEGLILGAIVSKVRSVIDDASDMRVKTVYSTIGKVRMLISMASVDRLTLKSAYLSLVVQGVYKLEPNLPKFYGPSGHINEQVLEKYSIPSNVRIASVGLGFPISDIEERGTSHSHRKISFQS